mmetsp:Transcript_41533/g.124111  ORF Transcript_41533/g.124111 Transcript_41533/m.124111 type:complete len:335 (+) Transcript_41533:237-1241(+)
MMHARGIGGALRMGSARGRGWGRGADARESREGSERQAGLSGAYAPNAAKVALLSSPRGPSGSDHDSGLVRERGLHKQGKEWEGENANASANRHRERGRGAAVCRAGRPRRRRPCGSTAGAEQVVQPPERHDEGARLPVARAVRDHHLPVPDAQAAREGKPRTSLLRPGGPQGQLGGDLQDLEGRVCVEAVGEVGIAAGLGVPHVEEGKVVRPGQLGRRLGVIDEDGLGRAAEEEAGLLRLEPSQRAVVGVDLAAARAVLVHLHDDVGQYGVDKVEVPAVFERDPVLLRSIVHTAPQWISCCNPLRLPHIDPRCQIHLMHVLALLTTVAAQGGI